MFRNRCRFFLVFSHMLQSVIYRKHFQTIFDTSWKTHHVTNVHVDDVFRNKHQRSYTVYKVYMTNVKIFSLCLVWISAPHYENIIYNIF